MRARTKARASGSRLIDDLLDVSRITSGKIVLRRVPTPLAELMQSAIEAQRGAIDQAGLDLTVDLPDAECVVDVDPTRFVQVMSNVVHARQQRTTRSAGWRQFPASTLT